MPWISKSPKGTTELSKGQASENHQRPSLESFYEYFPSLIALSFFGFPLYTISKITKQNCCSLFRSVLILFRLFLLIILLLITLYATFVVYILLNDTKLAIGYDVFLVCILYNALVCFGVIWYGERQFVVFLDRVKQHCKRFLRDPERRPPTSHIRRSNLMYFTTSMAIIFASIVITYVDFDRSISASEFLVSYNSSVSSYASLLNTTNAVRIQQDGLRRPMPYLIFIETFNVLVLLLEIHVCQLLKVCFNLTRDNDDIEKRKKSELGARHYYWSLMVHFKNCHESTFELVEMADTLISTVIFVLAGGVLISTCCIVYSVKNTPFQPYQVAIVVLLFMHVFYFVVLVFQAAEVNDKILEIADHLKGCVDVVQQCDFDDDFRIGIKLTALYMARMTIVPQGITTIGLFVVRRDLILTVFGAALTYSIILYDLN